MFVDFDSLPDNSKIWIYQSDRAFTQEEISIISERTIAFMEEWTRHGSNLRGSFTIKYNQFLVLAVDEDFNAVSGCSIDASVHFVQELEKIFNVEMMNKMKISFKEKNHIRIVQMNAFKTYARENKITSQTVVFNHMISTKKELEGSWEVPAEQSWHKRLLV